MLFGSCCKLSPYYPWEDPAMLRRPIYRPQCMDRLWRSQKKKKRRQPVDRKVLSVITVVYSGVSFSHVQSTLSSSTMSPKKCEDLELQKISHLTPGSETVPDSPSQLMPPSGSNSPTLRDIRFVISNETLRDEYQPDRIGGTPPDGTYQVHCQSRPRPRSRTPAGRESGWQRAIQNFTPSYAILCLMHIWCEIGANERCFY